MTIVEVSGLGKAYRRYRYEFQRVLSWFGVRCRVAEERWVLRDIDFAVEPGEAVGIVGQNGAGKSTLLKLLTGTSPPTEGGVRVNGRIAAILELGMGFNPEFSGRQNCFHAAGLMGFSRAQVEQAMPGIEEFAEIGAYFDAPVRTYSSGMQMRVAFSLATAFRPDVLIIDEALSVGDTYFQHKSFDRIRSFQRQGTTLLVVSHDKAAVQTLCTRAILLDKGRLVMDGAPEEVLDYYNALIAERENKTVEVRQLADGAKQTISGTGEARVETICLRNRRGQAIEYVTIGEDVDLCIRVRTTAPIPRLVLGYMIKDRLGQPIFGTNTWHTKQILEDLAGDQQIDYRIRFTANLGPGSYSVATALVSSDTHLEKNYEWRDLALVFNVVNVDRDVFVGVAWLPPEIEITRNEVHILRSEL